MGNLHRIMGSTFQHVKTGLCEHCALRSDYGGWEGYCTARKKILSANAKPAKKPRCEDYERAIAKER